MKNTLDEISSRLNTTKEKLVIPGKSLEKMNRFVGWYKIRYIHLIGVAKEDGMRGQNIEKLMTEHFPYYTSQNMRV